MTADLEMVRKGSLESAICLGLHDSDASCCQVIAPSAFIFVTFQIVTKLFEERLQRQVLGPRVPVSWFRDLEGASLDLLPMTDFEPLVRSDLVPIQKKLIHVGIVR